jgi:restriction endonuclease S subunit
MQAAVHISIFTNVILESVSIPSIPEQQAIAAILSTGQ